jgi:hypothetical protein
VLSVDTKKKELVGDFKTHGREWHPHGTPEEVKVHDFIDPARGRAVPYGVYDIANTAGWVSVGNGHRVRLWKLELQKLANEPRIPITVCHLPPGTGKWNKIEHSFSRSSPSIGAANHCANTKPSSNRSARPPQNHASSSAPNLIPIPIPKGLSSPMPN